MVKSTTIVFGLCFTQLVVCSDFSATRQFMTGFSLPMSVLIFSLGVRNDCFRPHPFTTGCFLGASVTGFAKTIQSNISSDLRILSFAASSLFGLITFVHAKVTETDYNSYPLDGEANRESKKAQYNYGLGFITAPLFIKMVQCLI